MNEVFRKDQQLIDEIRAWMLSRGVSVESADMIPTALKHEYELGKQRCELVEAQLRAKDHMLTAAASFIDGLAYSGDLTEQAAKDWLANRGSK